MSKIGDKDFRRGGLEACGLALLLCLLLAPGAYAQKLQVPRLVVKQTARQSLTLIKPSDPLFDGMMYTYFPGLSNAPAYKTSLRPFLVILRNDTAQTAVAYSITWTVHYSDASPKPLRAIFINRPLTLRSSLTHFPPGQVRLVSPMFNLTPKQYAQQQNSLVKYPANAYPWTKWMTTVDVSLDGVVYGGGTFIGPDKTRVLQRYAMAQFAARDEALSALNMINSSTSSPAMMPSQLEEAFTKASQWGQRADRRTLLALYVSARGSSAMDLRAILVNRGLAGLEKILQDFVSHHSGGAGGNASPSSFDHVYKKLSDKDPRVF